MTGTDPVARQLSSGETRSRLSAAAAWRWSGVLLMVGAGLGMVADGAQPVPFYTETSARVDADAQPPQPRPWSAPSAEAAVAVVRATRASLATGSLRLDQNATGANLIVNIEGLVPGVHEVRVQASGDCSDDRAESMGEAYAFDSTTAQGATGTLATLTVGPDWTVRTTAVVPGLRLSGATSVVGRALMIRLIEPAPGTDASPGTMMACGTLGVA